MITGALDPLIHSPARLRIVGTLAALPGGDVLSVARLRHLTGLDPGRLIADLGTLAGAGYVQADKAGDGAGALTTLALTRQAAPRWTGTSPGCGPFRLGCPWPGAGRRDPICASAMPTARRPGGPGGAFRARPAQLR